MRRCECVCALDVCILVESCFGLVIYVSLCERSSVWHLVLVAYSIDGV